MALRFNDKDAVYLSKNTRLRTERAGVLLKRGETNTAFKQRYFVLKANLLFYFKAANVRAPHARTIEDERASAARAKGTMRDVEETRVYAHAQDARGGRATRRSPWEGARGDLTRWRVLSGGGACCC